jgi:hypothetical protein
MLEVAEHYYHFGGKSPINEQNRALIAALERELNAQGPALPRQGGRRLRHLRSGLLSSAQAGGGQIRGGTVTTMARAPVFPAPR